jgi:4-hydroxyphenylpyruvate dioxygenase
LPKDQVDEDLNVHVQDLKKLAQMGAEFDPPIGIMYEALSWSTLVGTWQKAQRVVETVDEPNFWLCHDIFHVGSLLYADYFRDDGVQTSLEGWNDSIRELRTTKNGGKTFVCQLTDSYRLSPPFPRNELWTDGEEHHYLSVSRSSRPLPGEGYLPCREFIDALLASGYTGWFSVETFVPDYEKAGQGVPLDLARRAWSCMEEYLPGQSSSSSSS